VLDIVGCHGIELYGDYNTSTGCEVTGVYSSIAYHVVGQHNLVTISTTHDNTDTDVFRCTGRYNTFLDCEAYDEVIGPNSEHGDCLQIYSPSGEAQDIVVERCYFHDMECQAFYMTNSTSRDDVKNVTFRNNIWANISMCGQTRMPNSLFYNNVFYKVGQGAYDTGPINLGTSASGDASGSEIIGNIFLECGPNPASLTQGWYFVESGSPTYTAHNNYVGGTAFAAKTITETGVVNGGDPKFLNLAGLNFHLTTGSPLIDVGSTVASFANDKDGVSRPIGAAWDIGPYEYGVNPWVMIYG
jgi:hypothetical protein